MRRQNAVEKEWVLQNPIEHFVVKEIEELSEYQARRLVSLIKNGCESAYIARYRGDVHGGLPPERIRAAINAYFNAIDLNKKVTSTISTLTSKINGAAEKQSVTLRLKECEDADEVTEISKEFATGARKTKAKIARDFGLEPAAKSILEGKYIDIKCHISDNMRTLQDVEEHLKILLADLINKDGEVRKDALKIVKLETKCFIQVCVNFSRDAIRMKKEQTNEHVLKKYEEYVGNKWRASTIKEHTISAINRGTDDGLLTWKVEISPGDARKIHPFSRKRVNGGMQNLFEKALTYSLSNYYIPMLERGVKRYLLNKSIARAILIFGQNVEQLFAQQGIRSKYVIALDPGRTVKSAFLDPNGNVIAMDQFSIHGSSFDKNGAKLLTKWSGQTEGKDLVFAVGNGSNTHNTQMAVSELIERKEFMKGVDVWFCNRMLAMDPILLVMTSQEPIFSCIIPEHGASKYSCTPEAMEEFPEGTDIKLISAVSIGRRLIDPMSEYCKIEPQHLGKGQYQLSVDEKLLKEKLGDVVRDRVSLIGADLNVASKPLLQNICGLNQATAAEIVKYREKNGKFKSREALKRVKGIGEITFQQCAGFLTVSKPEEEDGPPAKRFKPSADDFEWSPFDQTVVHPDDYQAAGKLLQKLKMTVDQITNGQRIPSSIELTPEEDKILHLLQIKPDLKPPPTMQKKARVMKDLCRGERFTGTVANKTDFGIFIDIGVEKDGMIHMSHFRNEKFDIPAVGDHIEVIVEHVQGDRISLKPA